MLELTVPWEDERIEEVPGTVQTREWKASGGWGKRFPRSVSVEGTKYPQSKRSTEEEDRTAGQEVERASHWLWLKWGEQGLSHLAQFGPNQHNHHTLWKV